MKINYQNPINNIQFSGVKAPTSDDLRNIKRFVNCGMDSLESGIIDSVKLKAPHLIKNVDGFEYVSDFTMAQKAINGVKSFLGIPLDVFDYIAKKFPGSKLDKAGFLQRHRDAVLLENEVNAYQGILKHGAEFIDKHIVKKGLPFPTSETCDIGCKKVCTPISDEFHILLNKAMDSGTANYDTKKERLAARIISGFTAAFFLGNDYYNKGIKKDKTPEEAQKEQHLKQSQEIMENVWEGIGQFAAFACFSRVVNKSVMASALTCAGIGLVARIISRKRKGMPLKRIEVPTKPEQGKYPNMNAYVESAKSGNTQELLQKQAEIANENNKPKKKPILSFKNILLFCGASIAAGYSLRYMKNHTEFGKEIAKTAKAIGQRLNPDPVVDVSADKDTMERLIKILKMGNNSKTAERVKGVIDANLGADTMLIGTEYRTTKLFNKIEVRTKDLNALKTAPFKFVKELVSYPYKIATKFEDAIKASRMKAKGIVPPSKPEPLSDPYAIKNIYKRFVEFEAKYGDDETKLASEFKKYMQEMKLVANNAVTSSKEDNSQIAVAAQTIGTLLGIGFNMTDEFNSSVRNGATKEEAEKDARLRGINKFFRMSVQVIIAGSLNSIFAKQYNNSIAKAGAVVATSTFLTDTAARVLSGMPNRKMTKEELERYQKRHEEGSMSWYYKLIDKLAS